MGVTVRIGFAEINRVLNKDVKWLERTRQSAVKQLKPKLLEELKKKCPKDTGKYAQSWRIERSSKYEFRFVTTMGKLFRILEYHGSKPHIIEPVRARVLHWIDKETGGHRFAKRVQHPGFAALPHVRPFRDRQLPKIRDEILQALRRKYKWIR